MPRGFHIASAWVDINADDKGLRQQVERMIKKAAEGKKIEIPVTIDSKNLRRELERAMKKAAAGQGVAVPVKIDGKGLRNELNRAVKEAAAGNKKIGIPIGILSTGLRREVRNAILQATAGDKINIPIGVSSKGLRGEIKRALIVAASGERIHVPVKIDVDARQVQKVLDDEHPTIKVDVDVQRMRQQLLAGIRQINVNEDVKINTHIDHDALVNQIHSEIARLRDRFRIQIYPDLNLNVSAFRAKILAAARGVAGNKTDIPIDLNPNINRLKLRAEAAAAAASIRAKITFNGELNTAMTRAKLMASLAAAQAGAHITVPVRYDNKQLRRAFGDIESAFRAIEGPTGRWAKIIQASALIALPAFALLDHAIRSTGASLAVTVPIVTMLVSAFAAAKIGMEGMGTAISGVFNEAILSDHQLNTLEVTLEGLAPSALRFVNQLKNVQGQFTDLRKSVQQILFSNLDNTLSSFAKQTLPVLKLGLAGTADQLNRMAQNTISVANTSARTGELAKAFGAIQMAMEPLVPMPGQILNALTKMTIAAAPLLIRMTTSFNGWSKNMTEKLGKAFDNGTLQASISKAGDTIVNFFRRIANNAEFTTFLNRMKSNGPEIAKTFGDIATALMKIINALAPISGVLMKVVDGFARFINAIPTVFLDAFIIKLVIFKTALGISALIKSVVTALGGLKMAIIALSSTENMMMLFAVRLEALGVAYASIMRLSAAFAFLTRAGILLGGLALTFVTLSWAVDKIFGDGRVHTNIEKMAEGLNHLRITGQASGEMARVYGKDFSKVGEAIAQIAHPGTFDRISHGFQRIGEAIGINGDSWTRSRDVMKAADKQLADLVKNGDMASATALFKQMSIAAGKNHTSVSKLNTLLPQYRKALKDSREAQEIAAKTMGMFGKQALEVSGRLEDLKNDTDGLVKSLFALNNTQRDANQAVRDAEQAATAMVEATKKKAIGLKFENGQLIEITKAQQDAAASIEDYASKTEKSALATYAATGNWQIASKALTDGKAAIIKAAEAAGMGTVQAKAYAESIMKIPSKKQIDIMVADQATLQLQDVAAAFRATPEKKTITVQTLNTAAIKGLQDLGYTVKQLPDGSFTVTAKTAPAEKDLKKIEGYKINPKTVEVLANIVSLTADIQKAQGKVDALKQKRKTAVGADKKKLDDAIVAAQKKVDSLKQKRKAELKALDKASPVVDKAQRKVDGFHGKTVTLTVLTNLVADPAASAAAALRKQADRLAGRRFGGMIRRAAGGGVPGAVAGPGGPTSDVIPAMLSNGEFVMKATAVKKYGPAFMSMINSGMFPKFAAGGPVAGTAVNSSATSGVRVGETSGTFTIKDGTGKPVASAVGNFKTLRAALGQAYADMSQKSSIFGTQFLIKSNAMYTAAGAAGTNFGHKQVSNLTGASNKSQAVWNSWKTGMTARTNATYAAVATQASGFQKNQASNTLKASSSTQNIWNSWRSGMVSKTSATYRSLNAATSSFRNQSVSAIGKARDGMGSAWSGLSPKFKPPVSYLVHTVINSGVVGSMNAIMSKLGGGKKVSGISVSGFARGGPIYGEGTATSDSIAARLSHGEYVIQAKAVKKFGVGFFNQVNKGGMPGQGAGYKPGFANGGMVNIHMPTGFASGGSVPSSDALNKILGDGGDAGSKRMTNFIMDNYVLPLIDSGSGGSAMKDVQRAGVEHIQTNVQKFVKENFGGAGSASAGLRWAKTQYGKKYQWGGNGNPSWDCSGFMSAIESVIRGEKPHRRWATGSFGSSGPSGWKRNANAPFKIGVTNAGVGHTAGTIGKENVESSGGNGVHGGVGVPRGASDGMFTSRWGYVGPNATKKATGGYISGPGGPTSDKIHAMLSNGEYVIRAAMVKKLGLNYLNSLNSGQTPGFASGGYTKTKGSGRSKRYLYHGHWYTLSGYKSAKAKYDKAQAAAKAQAASEKEARGTLTGNVTFSHFGQMAEAQGSFFHNEMQNSLGAPGDIPTLVDNLNSYAQQIRGSFHGATESNLLKKLDSSGKALLAQQKKLNAVNIALDTAKTNLDDLKGKFDELKNSVTDNIKSFGVITKIGKYGTSPETLLNQLKTDAGKATGFSDQLTKLKSLGLDPELISQIAQAGITEGGATANTILAMTPDQIKQLNDYQKQLTDAATKAGNTTADAMYGAGVKAAQGLVDGLTAQQKSIETLMMSIATSMEAAIKKALGIKSPSRVMAEVGKNTALGLARGMSDSEKDVQTAVMRLGAIPAALRPTSIPRANNDTMGNTIVNIENVNVTLTGTFDLSKPNERRAIAKALADDIKEEIRLSDRKRA